MKRELEAVIDEALAGNLSSSTIEGNTNDTGSREGVEVCARTRSYAGKDFIIVEST